MHGPDWTIAKSLPQSMKIPSEIESTPARRKITSENLVGLTYGIDQGTVPKLETLHFILVGPHISGGS